jgi:hypothetical protein
MHQHNCLQRATMSPQGPVIEYTCDCGWALTVANSPNCTLPGSLLIELAFAAHKVEWLEGSFNQLRADLLGLPDLKEKTDDPNPATAEAEA